MRDEDGGSTFRVVGLGLGLGQGLTLGILELTREAARLFDFAHEDLGLRVDGYGVGLRV